jgi:hypothetical protein
MAAVVPHHNGVIAGLVPAISIRRARRFRIGLAVPT